MQDHYCRKKNYQRSGRRANVGDREANFNVYNQARKALRIAIRNAQENSWREWCISVDNKPFGVPYRLVTKRLGRRPPVMDDQLVCHIARGFFPTLPTVNWDWIPLEPRFSIELDAWPEDEDSTPLFTKLLRALEKLPLGKAPGPDHVPNDVIKLAVRRSPRIFLDAFDTYLARREFPASWKSAKLVLLHKGADKPTDQPSSYRPIRLLDGAGKLLERLLLNLLEPYA